ncbi:MAG: hypothetical protein ABSB66_03920 [Candidatus Acidiferrales bacterium]
MSAIKPESHFFAVGLEMFRTDLMPRTHNPALQKRECGFNRVRISVALGVNAELVANRLVSPVLPKMLRRAPVSLPIVCEQNIDIFADILSDVLFEGSAFCITGMEEPEIAAALTDSNDDFFIVVFCRPSLPQILATNVRFVHFDFAAQHRSIDFNHSGADSVTEIPRRPVASDSERALHLASGHTFLGLAEKQGSDEPLIQGQMAVIENRSSGDGKLIVAVFAVEQLFLGLKFHDWHLAAQALDAFGPAEPDKQLSALFVGREHCIYIN